MVEQPHSGKSHDHVIIIALGNDKVIPDRPAGFGDIADAAAACTLDVVGEGEEGITAQDNIFEVVQPRAGLLGGQGLGPTDEVLLPHAVLADILLVAVDIAVNGVVPVGTAQHGQEGQSQNLGVLAQMPGVQDRAPPAGECGHCQPGAP